LSHATIFAGMWVMHPSRLKLANLPTPIHKLDRLSAEIGRQIYIWRDDMTGFVETGNKVRKLEFLLADALAQGSNQIVCAGGVHSNCTRAVAFCARRLGLEVAIVVREPKTGLQGHPSGNFFLNELAGAEMHLFSYAEYQAKGSSYAPFLEKAMEHYRSRGRKPYAIVAGGSQPVGSFGYIAAVNEMLPQWNSVAGTKVPDALFFADGSGGTHCGLHLGYELNGLPLNTLWAVNVSDSAEYFQKHVGGLIEETARQFNLNSTNRDLQVLDGHFGAGYGIASDDDLAFYAKLARQEGILLDPTYTGKAFRGMLAEIRKTPGRFGEKILFLHSGGATATFAFEEQYGRVLDSRKSKQ
jgi:D-cysteine desulfhydrase